MCEYVISYKNSRHIWNLVAAHQCAVTHQLRNTTPEGGKEVIFYHRLGFSESRLNVVINISLLTELPDSVLCSNYYFTLSMQYR
jgi:hypothetical protein